MLYLISDVPNKSLFTFCAAQLLQQCRYVLRKRFPNVNLDGISDSSLLFLWGVQSTLELEPEKTSKNADVSSLTPFQLAILVHTSSMLQSGMSLLSNYANEVGSESSHSSAVSSIELIRKHLIPLCHTIGKGIVYGKVDADLWCMQLSVLVSDIQIHNSLFLNDCENASQVQSIHSHEVAMLENVSMVVTFLNMSVKLANAGCMDYLHNVSALTKQQFGLFRERFSTGLSLLLGFSVKPSRCSDIIAECLGFSSGFQKMKPYLVVEKSEFRVDSGFLFNDIVRSMQANTHLFGRHSDTVDVNDPLQMLLLKRMKMVGYVSGITVADILPLFSVLSFVGAIWVRTWACRYKEQHASDSKSARIMRRFHGDISWDSPHSESSLFDVIDGEHLSAEQQKAAAKFSVAYTFPDPVTLIKIDDHLHGVLDVLVRVFAIIQGEFRLRGKVTPPRPSHSPSMLSFAARRVADELGDSGLCRDLRDTYDHPMDGYELAKTLEQKHSWDIERDDVDTLDDMEYFVSDQIKASEKIWFEVCRPELKFKEGMMIEQGEITGLSDSQPAVYLVRRPGHDDSKHGYKRSLIKAESAKRIQKKNNETDLKVS